MKLNLKEALIRYNILQEGWMEDLSNKYDEDTLIFVGQMLQRAYPDEDTSNHKLADWIAKAVKSFGKFPWSEDKKDAISKSFQAVLNFIKQNDNSLDIINKIKSMSAKQALEYVKKESKKDTNEESEISGEEELKEWLDQGLMRIVGRGPKGSFWVTPLRGEFFGVAQCGRLTSMSTHTKGEFGIGCQKGPAGGMGAKGIGSDIVNTYTLLAKGKDGHYTGIISYAGDINTGILVGDMASFGNVTIGSQTNSNIPDWSKKDMLNAFVNFMIENPEGKKIYKSGNPNTIPDRGFGELTKREHGEIFFKLLRSKPEFVEYYEPALKRLLGEEEYALLTIKARELYEKDPKRFIESLPTYLKNEREETLKILSEINFEDFIRQHGEEAILQNIDSLLKSMSYETFQELIKPYINYDKFLSDTDRSNIKEIIRSFSEKAQNVSKTFPIIQNIVESEEDFKAIIKNYGNGNIEKGLRAFFASLSTPRMAKHKNYVKTPEGVTATVKELRRDENRNFIDSSNRVIMKDGAVYDEQGNAMDFGGDEQARNNYIKSRVSYEDLELPIKEGQYILDYKHIRKLIEQKKQEIIDILGGGKKGQIGFLELLLRNSSAQQRAKSLKKEEDFYVDYYNKKFERGDSKVPGIIQLGVILAPEKELSKGNKIETAKRSLNGILRDSFSGPAEFAYIIPKKDYRNNIKYILKFYQNNSKGKYQIVDSASALMDTLFKSNVSIPEILELSQNYLDNLYSKNANAKMLIKFLYNLIHIIPASTTLKKFITKNIKENNVAKKIEQARIGRDPKTGTVKPDMFVAEKYVEIMSVMNDIQDDEYDANEEGNDLQEQEVRKYIKNLLESNFKKKKPISYSGVIIDEKSRDSLLSLINDYNIPENWERIAHHMTINMGPIYEESLLGKEIALEVTEIAIGDNVAAVKVNILDDELQSKNKIPHITLAVDRDAGGKPYMSNKLENWEPINNFVLSGIVEEVPYK